MCIRDSCSYEAVIRVNSQSGKSGAAWILEQNHGLVLPRGLQQDFSRHVQEQTDRDGNEMTLNALWQLFRKLYGPHQLADRQLLEYRSESQTEGGLSLNAIPVCSRKWRSKVRSLTLSWAAATVVVHDLPGSA